MTLEIPWQPSKFHTGNQGLRSGCAERQACLARAFGFGTGFSTRKSPAKRRDLRRNGPVRVQFPSIQAGPRAEPGHESGWPNVISPCSAARRSRCSAPATAASMSTPPSAPAATAAPSSISREPASIGIDRDRTAISGGFDLVDRSDGRLTLVEDRFSNLAEVCAAQGLSVGRWRRDGRRGVLDAARSGRARLLVSPRRPARHADGP